MKHVIATIRRLDVEQRAMHSSPFEIAVAGYQPVAGTLEIQWINGGFRTWFRSCAGTFSIRDIRGDWDYTSATECRATAFYPAVGNGTATNSAPSADVTAAMVPIN